MGGVCRTPLGSPEVLVAPSSSVWAEDVDGGDTMVEKDGE